MPTKKLIVLLENGSNSLALCFTEPQYSLPSK